MIKITTIVLLMMSLSVSAQKVKWENDTIYKDNVPYALLKKSGGLDAVYSLSSLNGKEIFIAKFDANAKDAAGRDYYRVTFLNDNAVGHFPNAFSTGKSLAKAVVENDLVKDGDVNPDGEKRFLALYPEQHNMMNTGTPGNVIVINNGTNYNTADRDRHGFVMVMGGTISQSNVNIGTCTSTSGAANGSTYTTVSFYLLNGTKCAEATFTGAASHDCSIVTMKDSGRHSLHVTNMAAKEQEIAKWLSDNYYL